MRKDDIGGGGEAEININTRQQSSPISLIAVYLFYYCAVRISTYNRLCKFKSLAYEV